MLLKMGIKAYQAKGKAKDALKLARDGKLEVLLEAPGEKVFFPLLDNNGLELGDKPPFRACAVLRYL
jgi:hypothetical protein